MMRKRWLAAVLSVTLLLAGCQSGNDAKGETVDETKTKVQETVKEEETKAETEAEEISLKYLHNSDSFDPETDYTRELIKELLHVNIIPEMGNEDDKVNLILNSGQDYDMIKLTNRNLLVSYMENDIIHPLNEYIDKYPDLKNAFTQDEWEMVSFNGQIYAIPETNTNDVEWDLQSEKTGWMY